MSDGGLPFIGIKFGPMPIYKWGHVFRWLSELVHEWWAHSTDFSKWEHSPTYYTSGELIAACIQKHFLQLLDVGKLVCIQEKEIMNSDPYSSSIKFSLQLEFHQAIFSANIFCWGQCYTCSFVQLKRLCTEFHPASPVTVLAYEIDRISNNVPQNHLIFIASM